MVLVEPRQPVRVLGPVEPTWSELVEQELVAGPVVQSVLPEQLEGAWLRVLEDFAAGEHKKATTTGSGLPKWCSILQRHPKCSWYWCLLLVAHPWTDQMTQMAVWAWLAAGVVAFVQLVALPPCVRAFVEVATWEWGVQLLLPKGAHCWPP